MHLHFPYKISQSVEPMSKEKRRFSRILFNVSAKLQVGEAEFSVDTIENLSVGGCLLELSGGFELEQDCRVTIALPHMAPGVEIFGKIVRVEDERVGVQFTTISPENLAHLQNIIRYNSEDPEQIEEEISARPGLK